MKPNSTPKFLMLGTALTLSMAGGASAATNINLNPDVVPNLTQECQDLVQEIENRDNLVPDNDTQTILDALNNDNPEECITVTEALAAAPMEEETPRAEAAPTETETDDAVIQADATETDVERTETESEIVRTETETETETAETTESVRLEQEAVIKGQAAVIVPEPQVDVAVDAPKVTVRKSQPEVNVQQSASTIQVEQQQPKVAVEIPEIIVRVEIPAPSIFIQSDAPTVDVASGDPQIEVVQAEPRITVTQGEPRLDVDLDLEAGDDVETTDTESANVAANSQDGSETTRGGDVNVTNNEPVVEYVEAEGEPRVTVTQADPQVQFTGAEPDVTVSFAQQPTIEITQTSEPQVTFETAEERQTRADSQQAEQPRNAVAEQPVADPAADPAMGEPMLVSDLLGMEVIGANDEELGEPAAIIDRNGEMMLVIEDGGFLGLGENRTAVPMSTVTLNREEGTLRLQDLTEEQLEEAGTFEWNPEEEVAQDASVRIK